MAKAITGACNVALPNVTLHLVTGTSEHVTSRVREDSLDIAMIFDGDFASGVARQPLFKQQVFLVLQSTTQVEQNPMSWDGLRNLPLILPAHPHADIARIVDALFDDGSGASPALVENDVWAQISAVQAGLGNALLAMGDLSPVKGGAEMKAVPLDPPVYMTVSQIKSAEKPLTPAADATMSVINNLISRHLDEQKIVGGIRVGP
jgi:LysR family nitrogen assimilation transcriptional regulator